MNQKIVLKTFILFITLVSFGCKNSQDFFEKSDLRAVSDVHSTDVPADPTPQPSPIIEEPASPTPVNPIAPISPLPPVIEDPICKTNPKICDLTPVVSKPGVVTMLVAFGDLVDNKLVITEASSRLIAQNAVKFASPLTQPKILVVKDYNNQGESSYDTEYIAKILLANYAKVDVLNETSSGLKDSDVEGYDLIWFNNPGHPMGNVKTMNVLLKFQGGVILSGDDLTRGTNFSLEALTGLKYIDNGVSISCNGKTYSYDNNNVSGRRYQVQLADQFFPDMPLELRSFEYGNDIDNSQISSSIGTKSNIQVLAYANGAKGACENNKRPVIVRYEK